MLEIQSAPDKTRGSTLNFVFPNPYLTDETRLPPCTFCSMGKLGRNRLRKNFSSYIAVAYYMFRKTNLINIISTRF